MPWKDTFESSIDERMENFCYAKEAKVGLIAYQDQYRHAIFLDEAFQIRHDNFC